MTNELQHHRNGNARSSSLLARALVGAGVIVGMLVSWAPEAAAAPEILRPGTRPWAATLGFGPSFIVSTGAYSGHWADAGRGAYQLSLQQEIGYHFQGESEGPALGLSLQEGFMHSVHFEAGAKFWWDIRLVKDMAIYLAPEGRVGFSMWTSPFDPGFDVQLGLTGKVILDDRWLLFLRPLTQDFNMGPHFVFEWNVMLGGGVTF